MIDKKTSMNRIILFGITHLFVDALCIGIVLSLNTINEFESYNVIFIILYNLIAFGVQPIWGYLLDIVNKPYVFSIIGCILCVASILFLKQPYLAVLIAGIGNGLFHVGGGVVSIYATPNKAKGPGLFVAPGAIGVLLGGLFFKNLYFLIVIAIILIFLTLLILNNRIQTEIIKQEKSIPEIKSKLLIVIITILIVILARALIGCALAYEWKDNLLLLILAVSAVVFGKGLGGILADRFGFLRVGLGSLVLATPLLLIGINLWYIGLIGLMVFNFTMPITLAYLAIIFKRYKGFAFGLTTLALAIGYVVNYIGNSVFENNVIWICVIAILASISLYIALKKTIIKV